MMDTDRIRSYTQGRIRVTWISDLSFSWRLSFVMRKPKMWIDTWLVHPRDWIWGSILDQIPPWLLSRTSKVPFHTFFIPIDQNPPTNENPKKHVDKNGQHSAHSNTDRENHHYFQSSWPTSIFTNNQQSTVVALYNPFVYIYSRKFFSYLEYIILQDDLTNWFPIFYSSCWICWWCVRLFVWLKMHVYRMPNIGSWHRGHYRHENC